jgi:putative glycerol-1-phosphate prenyltransferase
MSILNNIEKSPKRQIAMLIDPDKFEESLVTKQINAAKRAEVDFIFLGGSLISNNAIDKSIDFIKSNCDIPLVLFPGNGTHVSPKADAILFLSLISGRNADLLIGNHVHVAPWIKKQNLEAIPTGYMLIESGKLTTAQYISNTIPIPHDKADIASATAIAGELLGLKIIYLDAGSGAENTIPSKMISKVKNSIDVPLIVGGGIRSVEAALEIVYAGADIIVVGNAAEKNPELITDIAKAIHQL